MKQIVRLSFLVLLSACFSLPAALSLAPAPAAPQGNYSDPNFSHLAQYAKDVGKRLPRREGTATLYKCTFSEKHRRLYYFYSVDFPYNEVSRIKKTLYDSYLNGLSKWFDPKTSRSLIDGNCSFCIVLHCTDNQDAILTYPNEVLRKVLTR